MPFSFNSTVTFNGRQDERVDGVFPGVCISFLGRSIFGSYVAVRRSVTHIFIARAYCLR